MPPEELNSLPCWRRPASPIEPFMKATAQTLNVPPAIPLAPAAEKSLAVVLSELFKMRLTTLVLLTTLAGFYLGSRGPISYGLMLSTVLGAALLRSEERRVGDAS